MEKDPKDLCLTVTRNGREEDNFLLSQNELRQYFKYFRLKNQLSFEILGKLSSINPDLLRDYEEGKYELRPEFYTLLVYVFALLKDDFKVRN